MNFKRGKPHDKKDINWGTPIQIQRDLEDEKPLLSVPGIRKYECKRLKGPHKFDNWKRHVYGFNNKISSGLWERFCIGCQHKDTWYAGWKVVNSCLTMDEENTFPPGYIAESSNR